MHDSQLERFVYEDECGFYETAPLYVLNRFINEEEGVLLFIDVFSDKFTVIKVNRL